MSIYQKYLRAFFYSIAFLCLLFNVKTVNAEQTNILTNGSFEESTQYEAYPWNKQWPGFKGWFIRTGKDLNPKCGVVEDIVFDGKYSFRITKDFKGYLYISSNPGFDVSAFNGPYQVSAHIKTREEEKHPLGSYVEFCIWSWKKDGSNAYVFPVAKVEGTTDWKKYSGMVDIKDMRFTSGTSHWAVAIDASRFSGDIWIDDVRLIRMPKPVLKISLDASNYFPSHREILLKVTRDGESATSEKSLMDIEILGENEKVFSVFKNVDVTQKEFYKSIPIESLKEGTYIMRVKIKDSNDNEYTDETTFSIVPGPFD